MTGIIPFDIKEYLTEARSRSTFQFEDKPVFNKFLELILLGSEELQTVLKDLIQKRSVDTAEGYQLDIIGNIVGQARDPLPGYLFDQEGSVIPDDDLYRLLIKSKIIKNNTKATPEDVIYGAEFILGVDGVTIQEGKNASYIVYVPRYLTKLEKYLITGIVTDYYTLTLLPKPIGVRVEFVEFNGTNFFAFLGVPNARGFGTYSGTTSYGMNYGMSYGYSDFTTTDGGIFANLVEVTNG